MSKPLVAIVGRPNVGKSTFFNRMNGHRISIVKDMPGVTRDRIYGDVEWSGHQFTLIDTGGIDLKNESSMQREIMSQIKIATDLADVILFMVDGREGCTAGDEDVAEYLRKCRKPVMLVVNKVDENDMSGIYDFYKLGYGKPYPISSEQGKGLTDLLDDLVKYFNCENPQTALTGGEAVKIAVIGRPNGGKSSIVNAILGEKRVVVSDVAGTTRDAIDLPFTFGGKSYTLIDTAGIRRERGIEARSIESYSVIRSFEAVRRADIVLTVLDASDQISDQDVRIAGYVHEQGKPSIILVNKWDLVEKDEHTVDQYNAVLKEQLAFMPYFKALYISALTGQRVDKIMPTVDQVYFAAHQRIPTGILNDVVQQAVLVNEPKTQTGRRLKIFYATQVSVAPPTFVLFVNDETLVHFSYLRYLENTLRRTVNFEGTPIKIIPRNHNDGDEN